MRIVLTSGYNNSKHSLAVLELLRREGIVVERCIVIKTLSIKRVKYYFKQLDLKEFKKKFKDRILSNYMKDVATSDEIKYVNNFLSNNKIKDASISSFCASHGIGFMHANSLNSEPVIKAIQDVDLVIYTGGGIVGKRFINAVNTGVLNCHGASLPKVRGSNTAEWSVLLGIPQANSLHFMVRKIDMGPILKVVPHDYSDCSSIDQLRGKGIVYTIEDLVTMIKQIEKKDYSLQNQKEEEGKQYYMMHPILKSIVNKKLKSSCIHA